MLPDVYLYGAGGHCKVVLDILLCENKFNVKQILDDAPNDNTILGVSVVKEFNKADFLNKNCIITIGNNQIRKKIANSINANFIMAIHPNSVVSNFAKVGKGTQIMAGAIVNSDAVIGEHCIINTGAIVEHDCELGDYVHISPNATLGGNVKVGELSQVGLGATIIQNITIGKNVMIGAGAVIIEDIPDNAIVVGVPGKVVKYKEV
nr:acetyltransferase [Flavobacterium urocaniciphilum]